MDFFKPDYWQAFADGIGDNGGKEEVRGKQVNEAEYQHLQHHWDVLMRGIFIYRRILSFRNTESRLAHLEYGERELMSIEEHSVKRVPVVLDNHDVFWYQGRILDDIFDGKSKGVVKDYPNNQSPDKILPCLPPPCLGILCPELSPTPSCLEPGGNIVNSCSITNLQIIVWWFMW